MYTTERREEFYQSGDFEHVEAVIRELARSARLARGTNIVDDIGKERAQDFVNRAVAIIDCLLTMVRDARNDIELLREAKQNVIQ